jgi:iron complex outermembrane receptor protein
MAIAMLCEQTYAQEADTTELHELSTLNIIANRDKPSYKNCLNIQTLHLDSIHSTGFSLCDVLKKFDGVTVLSTGPAIAKPVIRGLYGNRVLVLMNGLKFDNQQWQEEHGIGLTTMGLSNIELMKGPLSIVYGTEAMGGIINLIEESKPVNGKRESDFGFNFNSNTLGGLMHAGYKQAKGKKWFRIRVGMDNHADYSNGNGDRVLNTRFKGYYLKSTFGITGKKWRSTNNFSSSFNQFGFVFNDIYDFVYPDNRWSRDLSVNPSHMVLLNVLSSENSLQINAKNRFSINSGIQSNKRMENEGGGAISLNMHLVTFQTVVKWEHSINEDQKITFSSMNSFENNTNYGSRKIVPNANMQESNFSVHHDCALSKHWNFENGMGIGEKYIQTFMTASVNSTGKEITPFKKQSPYFNYLSGISFFPNDHLNIKVNYATGVRVGNLAELSSDGLHEGVFTYEIGNPNLKNENVEAWNLFLTLKNNKWEFYCSPFYNQFKNYIYLAPTDEQWYGFPVYRYQQQDVHQMGLEASLSYFLVKSCYFKAVYSGMDSRTNAGQYTSFIPAQRLSPEVNFSFLGPQRLPVKVMFQYEQVFAQNHVAYFEKATPSYHLINANISTQFVWKEHQIKLAFQGSNLSNELYYDHLSRLKNYGIYNMGRNFSLQFNFFL